MRPAICNEMFKGWPHGRIARFAADLGYEGVELAPFTFEGDPVRLPREARRALRAAYEDAGLAVVGLHWLLAGTEGLSITSEDDGVLARTAEHLKRLTRLCGDLGGEVLVFGSPKQRSLAPGQDPMHARERVVWLFKDLALAASDAGVVFCFEPLGPAETNFINTMREGVRLVEDVDHPAVQLHLDVKAMVSAEGRPPAEVIREEGGRRLRHFHANDANQLGPGMGEVDQAPISAALKAVGYNRWVSVETFAEGPGPEEIARRSLDCLRRVYAHAAEGGTSNNV